MFDDYIENNKMVALKEMIILNSYCDEFNLEQTKMQDV